MSQNIDLKITVVGPGAVGCLLSHGLHATGYPVTLLDYRHDRAERICRKGISALYRGTETLSKPFCTAETSGLGVQDVIIFTVKAYQTENAALVAAPLVGDDTVLLSLQNGMGFEHYIERISSTQTIATGTTALGATLLSEGRVKLAGTGLTEIGFCGRPSEKQQQALKYLKDAFIRSGWECRVVPDPETSRWYKLMANVGINAITAAACIKNGEILKFDDSAQLQKALVNEAFTVMKHKLKGCDISLNEVLNRVRDITEKTSENFSSMLQDRLKRSMTEIDYINGFICKAGVEIGVQTPVNETLWRLIRLLYESGWKSC